MGVVTSTYDYGTLTFSLVVIQVTLKVRPCPRLYDEPNTPVVQVGCIQAARNYLGQLGPVFRVVYTKQTIAPFLSLPLFLPYAIPAPPVIVSQS